MVAALGVAVFIYVDEADVRLVFINEGASMEPTFCPGDRVKLDRFDGELERWQMISFRFPLDPERRFFKRVVGLPGEEIAIRDGTVLIDGAPIDGDVYSLAPPNYTVEPIRIPNGRYFVLGDNRRNSFDSHAWIASGAETADPAEVSTVPVEFIEGELPPGAKGC
jgi:signal peptidase I